MNNTKTYLIQKIRQSPAQKLIRYQVGIVGLNPGSSDPSIHASIKTQSSISRKIKIQIDQKRS